MIEAIWFLLVGALLEAAGFRLARAVAAGPMLGALEAVPS